MSSEAVAAHADASRGRGHGPQPVRVRRNALARLLRDTLSTLRDLARRAPAAT